MDVTHMYSRLHYRIHFIYARFYMKNKQQQQKRIILRNNVLPCWRESYGRLCLTNYWDTLYNNKNTYLLNI